MRRAASEEAQLPEPDIPADEARSVLDPARGVDASSPDAPKALKVLQRLRALRLSLLWPQQL